MKTHSAKRWLLALCLGLLALPLWLIPASAQAPAKVFLTTSVENIAVGDTFDVTVEIDASDVFGEEWIVTFDPTRLQVIDIDSEQSGIQVLLGPFLDPNQGFVVANRADNSSGEILCALTLLAPASPVTGGGQLATVTFHAVSGGETMITLEHVLLATQKGTAIPADIGDQLAIRINEETPITATASPVPSTPALNVDSPASPASSTPSPTNSTTSDLGTLAVCSGTGGLCMIGFGITVWVRRRRKQGGLP